MRKENYLLHKLHSLTGIIPVGFYLVQHLTLNTFTLAGPDAYNSVIKFFEHMPPHVLAVLKYGVIWLPLIFHAVYGLFISARADWSTTKTFSQYREQKYFNWQRWSGMFAFLFLCYHMASTSVAGSIKGAENTIYYDKWAGHLQYGFFGIPYLMLLVYILGVVASAYHFSYGLWNFAIRWGITVNEKSQQTLAKVSKVAFVGISALGIAALVGFFLHKNSGPESVQKVQPSIPVSTMVR